jgi:hypothetical protein
MTRFGLPLALLLLAAAVAGCGGSDKTAATQPTVLPPPPPTTTTATTATTKKPKKKHAKAAPKPVVPVKKLAPPEVPCGKIYFSGLGQNVPVSAAALPCGSAKSYAKRFVSTEQPSQKYLPPGWRLADCTGINDAPPTPGEPNSPRCHRGQQAFTIHFPKG